mmetsp:Transcript_61004/g.133509  ORF Transcript_61004/g.133509 Transcript_61004/m.133509 type:complete len:220 (+) Transcript_61004:714-1373(+)
MTCSTFTILLVKRFCLAVSLGARPVSWRMSCTTSANSRLSGATGWKSRPSASLSTLSQFSGNCTSACFARMARSRSWIQLFSRSLPISRFCLPSDVNFTERSRPVASTVTASGRSSPKRLAIQSWKSSRADSALSEGFRAPGNVSSALHSALSISMVNFALASSQCCSWRAERIKLSASLPLVTVLLSMLQRPGGRRMNHRSKKLGIANPSSRSSHMRS